MPPSHELRDQLLRDGVFLDEPRQEPLAEVPHQRLSVPCREGVERSVVRECAVGHENVKVDMPLQKVAARGDRDHDPGPCVGSDLPPHVLAECLRTALREIEKKRAAPPEQRTQEPWHGQHHVTMPRPIHTRTDLHTWPKAAGESGANQEHKPRVHGGQECPTKPRRGRSRGLALVDESLRVGVEAFVHPRAAPGVLLELKEAPGLTSPKDRRRGP